MQILPYALIILFVVFLIGIIVILGRLRAQEKRTANPETRSATSSPAPATSASAPSEGLETMRLAVERMDTDHIENLLEMGATLKPGAEEIFQAELAKRRSADPEA